MNMLYAFGCSFTDWTYYQEYKIYDTPPLDEPSKFTKEQHWIHKLATKLGMNSTIKGQAGTSNEGILRKFYEYQHRFKEGDAILLQATFGNRFTFYHNPTQRILDLSGPLTGGPYDEHFEQWKEEPWSTDSRFIKLVNDYMVLYNEAKFNLDVIYRTFPMISEWCDMKGIKIVFWALDDYNTSPYLFHPPNKKGWMNWISENNLTIYDELGNDENHSRPPNDNHLGRFGFDTMVNQFLPKFR